MTVIDVTDGAPLQSDMTVVVTGNRITAVGKTGKVRVPKYAQVIDAGGKFLIPGLWDMHIHIFNNASRMGTNNSAKYFPLLLANGVTGVRDMWTDPDDIKLTRQWQMEMDAGKSLAPRIAVGSSIVDGVPALIPNAVGVSTPHEARRAVRTFKNAGSGFIKVYWNLSPESYYAIADESKKLGIAFAGHVPFSISAADASDAGQKSIEHLTGLLETCSNKEEELRKSKAAPTVVMEELWKTYDEQKCRALFTRFAKNRTWHTPTIVLHRMLAFGDTKAFIEDGRLKYVPADEVQSWLHTPGMPKQPDVETRKVRFRKLLETVGAMQRAGVPILAGTDVGNPFIFAGFSLHDELELFVEAGLTPLQALRTATLNPATYLGMTDSLGTIAKGKLADLVVLEANPLESIGNTRKIAAVIVNGRYLPQQSLQRMLDEVAAVEK